MRIRPEATLGPRDPQGIGVKLCRADGPAAGGTGEPPGRGGPFPPPPAPSPPSPRSRGTDSAPAPSPLPLALRSLAGSSSLARPRPAQLGQSDRGAERASARGLRLPPRPAAPSPAPSFPLPRWLPPARPPRPAPAPSARRAPRGPAPPVATMPAARPPAAGLGGISLLLALLLGSPAAALAGGKRREGRAGGGGKVAARAGRLGVLAGPGRARSTRRDGVRGRLPTFGWGNRVPVARADASVEAGMCLKDSGASLRRLRAPFRSSQLRG